jgi:hypothetical protein
MDMKTKLAVYALAVTLAAIDSAHAQSDNTVTADNFLRAESHMYFANVVKQVGTGNSFMAASRCRSTTRP